VESGTLVFGGERPSDPKIDVTASDAPAENPIKVYLHATGSLHRPKLELSSDPAMEQRDIVSYLLTGKPLYKLSGVPGSQGTQGGANGSQVAATNMVATYLSRKAAAPLVRKLDIDVLNLRMTSGQAADVTIGRYLTSDLFISYDQVLSPGGERQVLAEYTLTPWWSLQGTNSSQGNYVVDLIFKFGIK
jgi:translocation and assembly module TamB